jgi:hypothetical protein
MTQPAENHFEQISLLRLALVCYVFGAFAEFDKAYEELLEQTNQKSDPGKSEHRKALLNWLNRWQMRHISKANHEIASKSLLIWWKSIGRKLPDFDLRKYSDMEINLAGEAYAKLSKAVAAKRPLDTPRFGITAASKIMFALHPDAFPPWDQPICRCLGYDGQERSYKNYLRDVKMVLLRLEKACRRYGFSLSELPDKIGRKNSTPVKLIDEYNWLVITKEYSPPDRGTLKLWLNWSD